MPGRSRPLPRSALMAFALIAFVAKIGIAYKTYGTNDAVTFERDIVKLNTDGPERLYLDGVPTVPGGPNSPFSHSPPVIHLLRMLAWCQSATSLPVRFWIRVICSLADLCTLMLVWMLGIRSMAALSLLALSPISLMVSGFHVNTDPAVVCLVVLAAWFASTRRPWLAGLALGGALALKVLALIFLPVLLLRLAWRQRLIVSACAAACLGLLSLPYSVQFPGAILQSMAGYSGQVGFWGIPAIFLLLDAPGLLGLYVLAGKYIALGAVLIGAIADAPGAAPQDVLADLGLAAGLFLVFTPGFGAAYLVYLLPSLTTARAWVALSFYATSASYLFAKYTAGSGGLPWYFCNLMGLHSIPLHEFLLELFTWVTVLVVCAGLLSRRRLIVLESVK